MHCASRRGQGHCGVLLRGAQPLQELLEEVRGAPRILQVRDGRRVLDCHTVQRQLINSDCVGGGELVSCNVKSVCVLT